MKSYMAKPGDVEKKWYVVDAEGMVLGKNGMSWTPKVWCLADLRRK